MTPIITEDKKLKTPFRFRGLKIFGVSTHGGIFGNCHFQLCGTAWGDGSYEAQELIDAGADYQEIASLYFKETGKALVVRSTSQQLKR